ncbi:hypothetical protein H5119_14940 [Pseudoalteromonas sp. SG45-5]|uniref:hypothetical protein n=1 Tax=unclassified Pseudoalteromonas TaxID=194690 RepID=UPI0015FC53A3|nr:MULTISPECIES: hypothetical protein [unclassified Pseudoalteromonas]MBB1386815.1 hypothetical protein [Pseudoalteromonas sp. SG45-5]MBB1394884.1 hypothetical protein [Pseudoalteromonas sp. SG44-4]MBB1446984.1 hypothetical protein [Pseudoalteromonas sp. SG41-6]
MKYIVLIVFIVSTLVYLLAKCDHIEHDSNATLSANNSVSENCQVDLIKQEKVNKVQLSNDPSTDQRRPLTHAQVLKKADVSKENLETSVSQTYIPFDKQEVNYEWADDFTYQLYDFFSANEQLAALKLKNVECRASLCQLQLSATEADSIEQAMTIANTLRSDEKWKAYSFYLVGQADENTMTIEIGAN